MGLTCEELVERVFAAPSVARLSALTLRTYRNSGAVPLLEHFSSIGLGCWSAPHAMAHLRALREEREAGRVSETRFHATRIYAKSDVSMKRRDMEKFRNARPPVGDTERFWQGDEGVIRKLYGLS